MPLGSVSDLRYMLRDAGNVSVAINGGLVDGILDHADGVEGLGDGGMVQTRVTTILVLTDDCDGLRQNAKIQATNKRSGVVTGYRVDRIAPEDDGELSRLYVARLT
jgi:hypothetical protein